MKQTLGWHLSMPFTSINSIFMEMNHWKFGQKQFTIHEFTKSQFTKFCSYPWKLAKIELKLIWLPRFPTKMLSIYKVTPNTIRWLHPWTYKKKKSIFLPPPFLVLWLGVTKELCALYVGVSVKASITDKRLARLLLLLLWPHRVRFPASRYGVPACGSYSCARRQVRHGMLGRD